MLQLPSSKKYQTSWNLLLPVSQTSWNFLLPVNQTSWNRLFPVHSGPFGTLKKMRPVGTFLPSSQPDLLELTPSSHLDQLEPSPSRLLIDSERHSLFFLILYLLPVKVKNSFSICEQFKLFEKNQMIFQPLCQQILCYRKSIRPIGTEVLLVNQTNLNLLLILVN